MLSVLCNVTEHGTVKFDDSETETKHNYVGSSHEVKDFGQC